MTPDTAALRALAARARVTHDEIAALIGDTDTVRALCDAADEVERLGRELALRVEMYEKIRDTGRVWGQ